MKKFYKLVSTHQAADGFEIHLDGRPVKCPSGKSLVASSQSLADSLQAEWAAQEDEIVPDSMPLTQIVTTQIDRVAVEREAMMTHLMKYLDTDLLCYRAGDDPPGQREAQEKAWNPWLEWFEKHFDISLETTSDLKALSQDKAAHEAVQNYVQGLDDNRFTALQLVVSLSGSIVLGLAFLENAISPQQVFDAAHVEEAFKAEIYNEEFYGADPLQEKKDTAMKRDLEAAAEFLKLL